MSTLINILPEFKTCEQNVNDLEKESKSIAKSTEVLQAEAKDLKFKLAAATLQLAEVTPQQEVTHCALQRAQQRLAELQQHHIKLECHSWRSNLNFLAKREGEQESNSKTRKPKKRQTLKCCKPTLIKFSSIECTEYSHIKTL